MKKLSDFTFDHGGRYMVLATIETYTRTESGRSWKKRPVSVERHVYGEENYTYYVSSVPFWNSLRFDPYYMEYTGAYSRAHYGYTAAGYIPVRVVTVLPGGEKKNIARFDFVNADRMKDAAGFREKVIVDAARSFSVERYHTITKSGGRMYGERITLYTNKTGDTCEGTFDTLRGAWVN